MRTKLTLVCITLCLFSVAAGAADLRNLDRDSVLPDMTRAFADPGEAKAALHDYPSDDSIIVGSVGFIDGEQVGYFWSVSRGDGVTETFSDAASVTSYSLDVDVIENALNNGAFVNWDVIINGVTVDNFTVNEGFLGTVSRSASFGAIAGPNYTVELRVTNEVAGGEGSHTFRYAGVGFNDLELSGGGGGFPKCLQFCDFCDAIQINSAGGGLIDATWHSWDCAGTDCPLRGIIGINAPTDCGDGTDGLAGIRALAADGCPGDFYWLLDGLDGTMDMHSGMPGGGMCFIDELCYMLIDGPCDTALQFAHPQVPSFNQ